MPFFRFAFGAASGQQLHQRDLKWLHRIPLFSFLIIMSILHFMRNRNEKSLGLPYLWNYPVKCAS